MVVRLHDAEPLPLTILRPGQTFGRQGEPAPGTAAGWTPRCWQPERGVWSDEPTAPWDDDEWDVVVESGIALRLARDRAQDSWVVAALID